MPKNRSYRLLCPIARALDRVGDRWALLILRDLHAGPARFGELQSSLPGLAANLLTSRLVQLQADGLIVHQAVTRGAVYALTEAGARTAPLLFELAQFGARYPAMEEVRRPGNLRLIVVTLKEALRRVLKDEALQVELVVDEERFRIEVSNGEVDVVYAPPEKPRAPVVIRTEYEAMLDFSEGRRSARAFAAQVKIERGNKRAAMAFLTLVGRAFGV